MPTQINDHLLSWATDLEDKARTQAFQTSRLPFLGGHVALMPDAHFGFGSTVGSVIPTIGAIVPAAVGVDIGCGMIAARLDLSADQLPDNLLALHHGISRAVPAGVGQGHQGQTMKFPFPEYGDGAWTERLYTKASEQFGSLGSGNHFIEVCLDEFDYVWIVLHSGSRGVGNELAKHHIDGAKKLMQRYFITMEDPELAYLVEGTPEFSAYIMDMLWAQDYAMNNRAEMLQLVKSVFEGFLDRDLLITDQINCHHNFTAKEHHHGRNMWVTRKGAIRARQGDRGVIPGSMGASSYIVAGLGNPASYTSCSHGAGRRMGRKAAERTLTVESLNEAMAGKTWNGSEGMREGNGAQLLDEHPDAYKNIDEVMANQTDLCMIEAKLHQILSYKGT